MLYYFDINTCIVTTVSGVSNTLTRRATLRLQLVPIYYNKTFLCCDEERIRRDSKAHKQPSNKNPLKAVK